LRAALLVQEGKTNTATQLGRGVRLRQGPQDSNRDRERLALGGTLGAADKVRTQLSA